MKNKWISVEDRLPDDPNEEVWVNGIKGITVGTCYQISKDNKYRPGTVLWADIYGEEDGLRNSAIHGVTYWMKMDVPEPPNQHED